MNNGMEISTVKSFIDTQTREWKRQMRTRIRISVERVYLGQFSRYPAKLE